MLLYNSAVAFPPAPARAGNRSRHHGDKMKKRYAVFVPGEFIAGHIDSKQAKFSARKVQRGNRRLFWFAGILPTCEVLVVLIIGLLMGSFLSIWPAFAVVFIYLFAALGDPWLWRKIYGRLGSNKLKVSFLLNFDMLYWFGIGWIMGCLI